MNNLRRMERAAGRVLPTRAKDVLGQMYNRWRSFLADRDYEHADVETTPSADAPRHVVVLVVDALRYDYLSDRTAPFLSERNIAEAIAPAPWTFPSVSSILTGRYPHEHGAMRHSDDLDDATEKEIQIPSLPETETTLSEVLGGAGFTTYGGFGFAMPFLALRSRFQTHHLYRDVDAEQVLEDHCSWIISQQDRRTFSYLQLSDLHTPHHPPDSYVQQFDVDLSIDGIRTWRFADVTDPSPEVEQYQEHKRRLYSASIRYVDEVFAEYFNTLKSKFGSDILVVVSSDHGEGFWEHAAFDAEHFVDSRPAYCVGHGGTPYECIARVPLWFDEIKSDFEGLASLIDIAPTVLDELGLNGCLDMTGKPVTQPLSTSRPVLTEGARYGYEKKAIYSDGWKVIRSQGDNITIGYPVSEEPGNKQIPPELKERLLETFPAWPDDKGSPARQVPSTVNQRLRKLGYR